MKNGKLVQSLCTTTAKAQSPLRFNRDLNCTKSIWLDDLSALLGLYMLRSLLEWLEAISFKTLKVSKMLQSCYRTFFFNLKRGSYRIVSRPHHKWITLEFIWNSTKSTSSKRLFWSAPKCHYCVHTCTNEPQRGGQQTCDINVLNTAHVQTC